MHDDRRIEEFSPTLKFPRMPNPPSLWTRGGLTLWQLAKNIYRAIRDDDLVDRASVIAFNSLLAFFLRGFRVYLHYFDTYSATYGSLGAVMILLVWLYVTGFAFLVGREIDAEIGRALNLPVAQTV